MFKKILKLIGFLFAMAVLLGIGLFAFFAKDLPDPTKMSNRQIVESTKIYDRTGEVILYDIHGEEKRTVIPFEEIPQFIKDATIIAEDDNFYHHIGIDWKGILRAAWANLNKNKISQGGSTITQQYIKNAYLGGPQSERTYARKIKEAILAVEMEMKYDKDEILDFYLNQVSYGSNAYGIEAAAQTFFNKNTNDLTLAEGALLASLPKAPSYFSPYGSHIDDLKARQEYILERMIKFGYITEEESLEAKEEELKYASQGDLKAHHFVTMIQEYLEEEYGRIYSDINMAGLKVYTTLDWDMQRIAEEAVTEGVERNEKTYRATNGALVAIDPKSGQVLALVGSKNYSEDQFNVATSPFRQPGSSFKPFAYAVAFDKGYSPDSMIFDLETSFGKFGPGEGKEYKPNNYDLKFRGPVTMRQALAQSINLPSVKVLHLAGVNDTINLAQDMGITTLKERSRYSLSLVLGGGEVKLIDETAAYGVFATEGIKHPTNLILRIEDADGDVLEEFKDESDKVLDSQVARQITSVLSDEAARAPMFGNNSKLYLPGRPAAAKTGTTQDYADGWTIGYTPSLVVGVWAGNNDFTNKMRVGAAGLYVAAPIWNDFMKKAYQEKTERPDDVEEIKPNTFFLPKSAENFNSPNPPEESDKPMVNGQLAFENIVKIDKISGKLATDLTPPDLIKERVYKEVHSILYYINQNDEQFENWENPVLSWAENQPCRGDICYNQKPPQEEDDTHTSENQPSVKITSPNQGTSISPTYLTIKADASAPLGIKQVDFFFNDQLVGSDTNSPYSVNFNISHYSYDSGRQYIKVRAYDQSLNRQEDEIYIKVD